MVGVIDASVLVDALVGFGEHGDRARAELEGLDAVRVPVIFGAEATSALRGLVIRKDLSSIRAAAAVEQVRRIRTVQYPFEPFASRAWELRDKLTVYDAWYVALAEWLGADLVTADDNLVNATGPRCRVRSPRAA